jgi:hypothetical protein
MRSRKMAVAGLVAALSLGAAPIAAASPDSHKGPDAKWERTHFDKSRDEKSSRDRSSRDRPSSDPGSRDVRDR